MKNKMALTVALLLTVLALGAQSVKVNSPNGSESWKLGSQQSISWTAPGVTKQVKIVLFKDGTRCRPDRQRPQRPEFPLSLDLRQLPERDRGRRRRL